MVQHYIHRGLAKKNFKENTIKAFKFSFKKKYGVETDLHVTKDKQFVCFHDFTLKKKFKLNQKIKEVNYLPNKYYNTNYEKYKLNSRIQMPT